MTRIVILLLASAAVFSTVPAPACGPFIPKVVFEPSDRPPAPDAFDHGKLGIVLGSYRVPYLVTAWRVLSGLPPNAPPEPVMERTPGRPESPMEGWLKARSEVALPEAAPEITVERRVPGQDFQWYLNCHDSAFENAAETLRDRVKRFGAKNAGVRQWVRAQDAVFANCGDGSATVAPPQPDLPPLLVADRQYQIAAALFYAGDFGKARATWLEIAKDTESPWRDWSPYLAARCLVRAATLGDAEQAPVILARAETELKDVAARITQPKIRTAAEELAEYVAGKLRPLEQMAVYARRLEEAQCDAADLDHLIHFWIVLDSNTFNPGTGSDLLNWLFAMRGKMSQEEMVARWQKERTLVWLVAALQQFHSEQQRAAELLDAAARIQPSSPAFATAAWARVRAAEEMDDRRSLLDKLLPELRRTVPSEAINWFLRERFTLARSFEEFIQFAPRRSAAEGIEGMDESYALQADRPDVLLDTDGARVLNRFIPLPLWMHLIEENHWTPHLRERLIRAGFVRALTAAEEARAIALSRHLRSVAPAASSLLQEYEGATTADARQFAAAWTVLKLPGLDPHVRAGLDRTESVEQLNPFRENWWCGPPQDGAAAPPGWLTEAQRKQAEREHVAGGGALSFVTPTVLAWAEKHPTDPRSPEALAVVVRASRYGCRDAATARASKQAFTLLHRRFPSSAWAKQTPFWYGEQ